jgi:putative ABC transport system substrate-binding protein
VADLVERRVAVIFAAGGTDPAIAARAATANTPIVFVSAADPMKTASSPASTCQGATSLA